MLYADLQQAVSRLRYKPGWSFRLHSGRTMAAGSCPRAGTEPPSSGTTAFAIPLEPLFLVICARVRDSGGAGAEISVEHVFSVPPQEYPVPAHRWLLDRVLDVERHEAMEFFAIGDKRPFYPDHGPSADLYVIREREAA